MELFIIHANIERYERLLATKRDVRQQALLRTLLQAEREKLRNLESGPLERGVARWEPPAPSH